VVGFLFIDLPPMASYFSFPLFPAQCFQGGSKRRVVALLVLVVSIARTHRLLRGPLCLAGQDASFRAIAPSQL